VGLTFSCTGDTSRGPHNTKSGVHNL